MIAQLDTRPSHQRLLQACIPYLTVGIDATVIICVQKCRCAWHRYSK
ncbi:MAG: hypothetical protein HC877_09760 [Thioploca sp.]|nr:hypothetical protein [Thioploca sp.]